MNENENICGIYTADKWRLASVTHKLYTFAGYKVLSEAEADTVRQLLSLIKDANCDHKADYIGGKRVVTDTYYVMGMNPLTYREEKREYYKVTKIYDYIG